MVGADGAPGAALPTTDHMDDDLCTDKDDVIRQMLLDEKPLALTVSGISLKDRRTLIEWLELVHNSLHLRSETFYLCIRLLDTYCSHHAAVPLGKIQLVGMAALVVASKYHDSHDTIIDMYDATRLCDGQYSKDQMVAAEAEVLAACDFRLSAPLVFQFLDVLHDLGDLEDAPRAMRLLSNLIYDTGMLYRGETPSELAQLIAAAADRIDPAEEDRERLETLQKLI